MNQSLKVAFSCVLLLPAGSHAAEFMFRATVSGRTIEGKPLDWTDHRLTLLGRDGQLHEFSPKEAKDAQRTAPRFEGYSQNEMYRQLRAEFDGRFEIAKTNHYLVVYPKGQRAVWADRFEQIYNAFTSYVRVRGFRVKEPPFPLVAVAFRNQAEYQQHVRSSGVKVLPGSLGFYSHSTNRVCLFDITGGDKGQDWSENAATIIHEAAHQVAFNLGVHSRTSPPPYWVPEGLATLFEAPGVWKPSTAHRKSDLYNLGRLEDFRHFSKDGKPPFSLQQFVASDTPFNTNGAAAYAQAWALSFYLSQTQPRQYTYHLTLTADRPVYSTFSSSDRLRYFQTAFGDDLKVLEANFMSWMTKL